MNSCYDTGSVWLSRGKHRDCALSRAILVSLFSHPTFIHKDVFSPGVMQFAWNLGVAALFVSPRGLAIP